MSLFKAQPMVCCICGTKFLSDPDKTTCTPECFDEKQWRKALYVMGEEYHEKPPPKPEATCAACGQTFGGGKHYMMDGAMYHEFEVDRD